MITNILLRAGARRFSISTKRSADFSHVVIGGGAVGTAIAAQLQEKPGNSVTLLEQHDMLGMETTSRNSEVIHAGLYYPKDSKKAKFCIRGKELIYGNLDPQMVPYRQCGKWIVAQNDGELDYLNGLHQRSRDLGVPTRFVSAEEAAREFPLIRAAAGALESPTTGIISAHDLTLFYQTRLENSDGTVAINTRVDSLEHVPQGGHYKLGCTEMGSGERFEVTASNVINSAGLHAPRVANMLLPTHRHFRSYFAKGNYYAYAPETPVKTSAITSKLIYPCPQPNAAGLGTHLTFDLGGQLRFGPDLEWIADNMQDASKIDYDVSCSPEKLEVAASAIQTYFPSVTVQDLQPSYSGVRPKLLSKEENMAQFADYYIEEEEGFPGFVNLIGIESPGLTSSWAIAEFVAGIV